jgi:hypothetical protein
VLVRSPFQSPFRSAAFNEDSIHIEACDVAVDCEFGEQVSASSGVCQRELH